MTELDIYPISAEKPNGKNILRDAQRILFRPGVQIRMVTAIILVIFAAIFPLIVLYGGYVYPIVFEIFVTVPLFYGLLVMARKATDGLEVSMRDLFAAFSRFYWRSLTTAFWFVVFMLLPLLLPAGMAYGGYVLYTAIGAEPATAAYAVPVLLLGMLLAVIMVLPAILLQMPAYLMMSLRVKDERISCFRAAGRSFKLLKKQIVPYLKLRMQLLLLDLISVASVCALFPLYTLPLYYCANAMYLDRLLEKEAEREQNPYLTSENNNFTIKTED